MNKHDHKRHTHLTYRALFRRDGKCCHLCGQRIERMRGVMVNASPWRVTIDHVVPKSLGGSDHIENLKLAHRICNELRGNIPVDDYILLVALSPR